MHDLPERWTLLFNRTIPNMALRIAVMLFGLSVMSFAVALTRTTGLGTSPISCVPATLSFMTPLTIGTWTFIINVAFVLVQVALLRREFNPWQLMQLPVVLFFSFMIDLFVPLTQLMPMPNYAVQLAFSCLGCVLTALGVFLTVKARVITLPGEGITLAVARSTGIAFPKCKLAFDFSNVAVAAALSLAFMGGLFGVREGTLISLFVGVVVGLLNRLLPNFERFCPTVGHITLTAAGMEADGKDAPTGETRHATGTSQGAPRPTSGGAPHELPLADGLLPGQATHDSQATQPGVPDQPPVVVTIARQYGSGGRRIGKLVAKHLGVRSYDESLIEMTAHESGLTPEYVRSHGESLRRGLLYSFVMQNYAFIGESPSETDTLFLAQATVITSLAQKGGCVVVGRCGNAVLASRPNVLNVYIHAPLHVRVKHVMKRDKLSCKGALETIDRIDRDRANHCRVYANETWGAANNYHLTIDSSLADPDDIASLIAAVARNRPLPSRNEQAAKAESLEL